MNQFDWDGGLHLWVEEEGRQFAVGVSFSVNAILEQLRQCHRRRQVPYDHRRTNYCDECQHTFTALFEAPCLLWLSLFTFIGVESFSLTSKVRKAY